MTRAEYRASIIAQGYSQSHADELVKRAFNPPRKTDLTTREKRLAGLEKAREARKRNAAERREQSRRALAELEERLGTV